MVDMEVLKNNPEGRARFVKLAEKNAFVDMEDGVYYLVYKGVRMYSLSAQFAQRLIQGNAISKI